MEPTDPVSLALTADTSAFTAGLAEAEASARNFSAGVTSAFSAAEVPARGFSSALGMPSLSVAVKGRDLDTVLAGLGQRLSGMALNAALKPLEQGISNSIASSSPAPSQTAGCWSGARARLRGRRRGVRCPGLAEGGVVAAPTYFPMASGVGLMGEAGAEAILPLARGADGALGVRTQASGGWTTTVNVLGVNARCGRLPPLRCLSVRAHCPRRGARSAQPVRRWAVRSAHLLPGITGRCRRAGRAAVGVLVKPWLGALLGAVAAGRGHLHAAAELHAGVGA